MLENECPLVKERMFEEGLIRYPPMFRRGRFANRPYNGPCSGAGGSRTAPTTAHIQARAVREPPLQRPIFRRGRFANRPHNRLILHAFPFQLRHSCEGDLPEHAKEKTLLFQAIIGWTLIGPLGFDQSGKPAFAKRTQRDRTGLDLAVIVGLEDEGLIQTLR